MTEQEVKKRLAEYQELEQIAARIIGAMDSGSVFLGMDIDNPTLGIRYDHYGDCGDEHYERFPISLLWAEDVEKATVTLKEERHKAWLEHQNKVIEETEARRKESNRKIYEDLKKIFEKE